MWVEWEQTLINQQPIHSGSNPEHTTNQNKTKMAKKKDIEKAKEKIVPLVCFCRDCKNGGEIEDFKVMCKIKNIWQHSPLKCLDYNEK